MRDQNILLAALPPLERQRLEAKAERVELRAGQVLIEAGEHPRLAFFPEGGMLSLLTEGPGGALLEVAQVDHNGMAGVSVFLHGSQAAHRVIVQIPATAWRVKADVLREELTRRGALDRILLCYVYTLLRQLSQNVVCHAYHTTLQRLCRWVLTAHDRVQGDTLQLTQAFVADMLGVRRSGVAAVEKALQDRGLIRIRHGTIRVLNRRRLESTTCECYEVFKSELMKLRHALSAERVHADHGQHAK